MDIDQDFLPPDSDPCVDPYSKLNNPDPSTQDGS